MNNIYDIDNEKLESVLFGEGRENAEDLSKFYDTHTNDGSLLTFSKTYLNFYYKIMVDELDNLEFLDVKMNDVNLFFETIDKYNRFRKEKLKDNRIISLEELNNNEFDRNDFFEYCENNSITLQQKKSFISILKILSSKTNENLFKKINELIRECATDKLDGYIPHICIYDDNIKSFIEGANSPFDDFKTFIESGIISKELIKEKIESVMGEKVNDNELISYLDNKKSLLKELFESENSTLSEETKYKIKKLMYECIKLHRKSNIDKKQLHTMRVCLLTINSLKDKNIPDFFKKAIIMASIYHDIGRFYQGVYYDGYTEAPMENSEKEYGEGNKSSRKNHGGMGYLVSISTLVELNGNSLGKFNNDEVEGDFLLIAPIVALIINLHSDSNEKLECLDDNNLLQELEEINPNNCQDIIEEGITNLYELCRLLGYKKTDYYPAYDTVDDVTYYYKEKIKNNRICNILTESSNSLLYTRNEIENNLLSKSTLYDKKEIEDNIDKLLSVDSIINCDKNINDLYYKYLKTDIDEFDISSIIIDVFSGNLFKLINIINNLGKDDMIKLLCTVQDLSKDSTNSVPLTNNFKEISNILDKMFVSNKLELVKNIIINLLENKKDILIYYTEAISTNFISFTRYAALMVMDIDKIDIIIQLANGWLDNDLIKNYVNIKIDTQSESICYDYDKNYNVYKYIDLNKVLNINLIEGDTYSTYIIDKINENYMKKEGDTPIITYKDGNPVILLDKLPTNRNKTQYLLDIPLAIFGTKENNNDSVELTERDKFIKNIVLPDDVLKTYLSLEFDKGLNNIAKSKRANNPYQILYWRITEFFINNMRLTSSFEQINQINLQKRLLEKLYSIDSTFKKITTPLIYILNFYIEEVGKLGKTSITLEDSKRIRKSIQEHLMGIMNVKDINDINTDELFNELNRRYNYSKV